MLAVVGTSTIEARLEGAAGGSSWAPGLGTPRLGLLCFSVSDCTPSPFSQTNPSGVSSWLPGQSDSGLAVDINHGECWWCDFYRLVCSMMLIHPIISPYINMVQSITERERESARRRVVGSRVAHFLEGQPRPLKASLAGHLCCAA